MPSRFTLKNKAPTNPALIFSPDFCPPRACSPVSEPKQTKKTRETQPLPPTSGQTHHPTANQNRSFTIPSGFVIRNSSFPPPTAGNASTAGVTRGEAPGQKVCLAGRGGIRYFSATHVSPVWPAQPSGGLQEPHPHEKPRPMRLVDYPHAAAARAALALAALLCPLATAAAQEQTQAPEELVAEVRIVGNDTIPTNKIASHINTKNRQAVRPLGRPTRRPPAG